MLIYTHKLEKYVINKIIPQLLLSPAYKIKGSFKRKIPYVTDVDIVNYVYPKLNKTNIKSAIIELINSLEKNPIIDLLYITCGTDDRFHLKDINEINNLKKILKKNEIDEIGYILSKYPDNTDEQLFFINEFLRSMYKLRWEPTDVLNNKLVRRNKIITFDEAIQNNCTLTIKYFVLIKSVPIGFDVAVYYDKIDCSKIYADAAIRTIKTSKSKNDYYYMLFPLKYYFRDNPEIYTELGNIIDKKFGLHKQIMVRIDTFHLLHTFKKLKFETGRAIIMYILKNIESYIPSIAKSNVLNMIKKTGLSDVSNEQKLKEWDIQLDVLYDEILEMANFESKDYYKKIIKHIPEKYRKEALQ